MRPFAEPCRAETVVRGGRVTNMSVLVEGASDAVWIQWSSVVSSGSHSASPQKRSTLVCAAGPSTKSNTEEL